MVRPLTDAQMVVAQGQENSARKALSYIERAFFAVRLSDAGFDREVIMAALTMSKSHLSTLISVGRRIPTLVIEAIGPAPKAGEPRWIALADSNSMLWMAEQLKMPSQQPHRMLRWDQMIVL